MNLELSQKEYKRKYNSEDVCLELIKQRRYGSIHRCPNQKCAKPNAFYKVRGRKAYSCSYCRHQLYPLVGTIFEESRTPLRIWFYAIYLMYQAEEGMSAKQLERALGVTYKTAWKMHRAINDMFDNNNRWYDQQY